MKTMATLVLAITLVSGCSAHWSAPWTGSYSALRSAEEAAERTPAKLETRQTTAGPVGPLAIGSRGPAVRRLQEALQRAGFDIAIDGDFGPATEAMLVDFQFRNGLMTDGVAGPQTKIALGL